MFSQRVGNFIGAGHGIPILLVLLALVGACNRKPPSPVGEGAISGQVLLADGGENGHAGISVFLGGTSYSARTAESGQFVINGVAAGTYSVMAEKAGYQMANLGKAAIDPAVHTAAVPYSLPVAILERSDGTSTSPTARLGSITGVATLMDADSGDGVKVEIEGTALVTVTDEAGFYNFVNVEPGRYVLTFTHDGYPKKQTTVLVEEGKRVEADDVAMEPSEPRSKPTPAAAAEPEATPNTETVLERDGLAGNRTITGIIEARDADGSRITDYSRIQVSLDNSDYVVDPDSQGRFVFSNLPPGVYTVVVVLDGGSPVTRRVDVTDEERANLTITIDVGKAAGNGNITGTIVTEGIPGQEAPSAAGVTVGLAGTRFTALADSAGAFRLDEIPAGTYELIVSAEGFSTLRVPDVEVPAGGDLDLGEITLSLNVNFPRVVGTWPADGAKDIVAGDALALKVKFSKDMNAASVREALSLQPAAGFRALIGPGSHPEADAQTLIVLIDNLNAAQPIRFDQEYEVRLAATARDTDGIPMKEPYSFRFRTGSPGIVSTFPADGEEIDTPSLPDGTIEIRFNTKIRVDSLDERGLRIRPRGDTIPSVSVRTDPRTGWDTAVVNYPLQERTNYSVTINRSVRDDKGRALGNTPYSFQFRTREIPQIQVVPRIHH